MTKYDPSWIKLDALIKNPEDFAQKLTIKDLEKLIYTLKEYYYNTQEPLVPDYVYDQVEDILREREPQSKALEAVGAAVKQAVKLPYFMPSQNKAKADSGDIQKFLAKFNGPYVLSHKLDGISMLLIYDRKTIAGKMKIKLYSRGNGVKGQDLTHLAKHLDLGKPDFSKFDGDKLAVRGELIMTKKVWDKDYSHDHVNVRNFVSGKANSKTLDVTDLRKIRFVGYAVIEPKLTPLESFRLIEKIGFHVAPWEVFSTKLTETILKNKLDKAVKDGPYQIDGIIVAQNKYYPVADENPKHTIAFKNQIGETAQTVVKKVIWNPSKDRKLKPVVIVDTIHLSGANINRVTAHNAKYVLDNKIGPGAIITLVRSGEVIPYIQPVNVPAPKADLPDGNNYKWTDSGIDIYLTGISLEVIHKRMVHMIRTIGVDNMGPSVLDKLVNMGYTEPERILNISLAELQQVGSLGKNAEKIYNSLVSLKKNGVKLADLMKSVNYMFDEGGIGGKTMQLVINEIGPKEILNRTDTKKLRQDLISIKGISDKTADKIISGLTPFKDFISKIPNIPIEEFKTISKSTAKTVDAFKNLRVVFTGVRDKDLEETIENSGGNVASSISKTIKNQVVVAKDPNGNSSKLVTARDLGLQIYDLSDFKQMYL